MTKLFGFLLEAITNALNWLAKLVVSIFTAAWDFVRDAVCWPFEQLLDVVTDAVSSVDLAGLNNHASTWGSLPAELLNVLGLLGVGEASAIIAAAIGIRLVLQLIPFTRLGS